MSQNTYCYDDSISIGDFFKEVSMRMRLKYRAFGFEGQKEWGDLSKDKVFMQVAITLPLLMLGLDFEIFV